MLKFGRIWTEWRGRLIVPVFHCKYWGKPECGEPVSRQSFEYRTIPIWSNVLSVLRRRFLVNRFSFVIVNVWFSLRRKLLQLSVYRYMYPKGVGNIFGIYFQCVAYQSASQGYWKRMWDTFSKHSISKRVGNIYGTHFLFLVYQNMYQKFSKYIYGTTNKRVNTNSVVQNAMNWSCGIYRKSVLR
jgi:hypothetical protein